MPFFRKRPVVIEARQFTDVQDVPLSTWCGGRLDNPTDGTPALFIPTREGVMRADVGDWIIRGVAGEFYPCKDDILKATYEPVDERPSEAMLSAPLESELVLARAEAK